MSQKLNYFLSSFVVGDGNVNSPYSSDNVQDESKLSQDFTSQATSLTLIVDVCKQTYDHKHNKQTTREQEAKQNKQTTREQEARQSKQTTREQEAKQNKQKTREQEAKQTTREQEAKQTTREQEARQNKQTTREQEAKQTTREQEARQNKQTIREQEARQNKQTTREQEAQQNKQTTREQEIAGRSQHGLLNYGTPIERSAEESNGGVLGVNNSGESSIIDRTVAFIVNAFSGPCGRLIFREN